MMNMDDVSVGRQSRNGQFLNMIAAEPDIAKVPVMIDSSKWDVITARTGNAVRERVS